MILFSLFAAINPKHSSRSFQLREHPSQPEAVERTKNFAFRDRIIVWPYLSGLMLFILQTSHASIVSRIKNRVLCIPREWFTFQPGSPPEQAVLS